MRIERNIVFAQRQYGLVACGSAFLLFDDWELLVEYLSGSELSVLNGHWQYTLVFQEDDLPSPHVEADVKSCDLVSPYYRCVDEPIQFECTEDAVVCFDIEQVDEMTDEDKGVVLVDNPDCDLHCFAGFEPLFLKPEPTPTPTPEATPTITPTPDFTPTPTPPPPTPSPSPSPTPSPTPTPPPTPSLTPTPPLTTPPPSTPPPSTPPPSTPPESTPPETCLPPIWAEGSDPIPVLVTESDPFTLAPILLQGSPVVTYTITHDAVLISTADSWTDLDAQPEDEGTYVITATNDCGSDSVTYEVTVDSGTPPPSTPPPSTPPPSTPPPSTPPPSTPPPSTPPPSTPPPT